MPVQIKGQHFKDLKETMDKVTERIGALEIKMMNKHKELMNKIETVEKKNRRSTTTSKEK